MAKDPDRDPESSAKPCDSERNSEITQLQNRLQKIIEDETATAAAIRNLTYAIQSLDEVKIEEEAE